MSQLKSIKLLLLGTLAVGKTSLARRLSFNTFDADYKSTIGVQLHKLDVDVDGQTVSVVVWDTDGDLAADALTSVYARGAAGALIVGDAVRPDTLTAVADLANAMDETMPGRPCICVVNKIDAGAPDAERMNTIEATGRTVTRTSALNGEGVSEALDAL
ncbi:MAG: Rab family GTPase, partial [Pseudomonadota bacterium]